MTTELLPGIIAVEVAEDAKNFTVIESHSYFPSPRVEHSIGGNDLPKGNWSIVGIWSEIDETDAQSVVHWFSSKYGSGYKDYAKENYDSDNAYESLQSLLQSKSLDIAKRFVLLKKS